MGDPTPVINTVLITGGLGYVGGRIAQALAPVINGKLMIGTHRDVFTKPPWLTREELIQMDFNSQDSIDSSCYGVDSIVHLAALNEIDSAAHPDQALKVNTLNTLMLLQAAERQGVKRFLYFSTAHIYGSPLKGIITEKTLPRPVHPYAITHRAAEDFIIAAHDRRILTGIIIRLSNGLGAPADPEVNRWTLVANDLCRQAVTQHVLALKSSGMQRRDFITLTDIAGAVIHLLALPAARCTDGIFNLGGENPLSIIDLAELIADRCTTVFGFKPMIRRPAPQAGEISEELYYRINKLKATGFTLQSNIDEEIDATLKLCQQAFAHESER